jgi:GNAT superfamily N-acetyltransferase
MTDPMDSLVGLQDALDAGRVGLQEFQVGALHPEVRLYHDVPALGAMRLTYAVFEPASAIVGRSTCRLCAVSLFVRADDFEGLPVFQAGIAVARHARSQGLGTKLFQQSIEELRNGLGRTPLKDFWIEAIVRQDNDHSNRIASRVLNAHPKTIVDGVSKEPAFQYFLRVHAAA